MQKGFAHLGLLVIGLLLILGAGYYIYFNQSKPAVPLNIPKIPVVSGVSKNIYTNQNLGFQFEYDGRDLKAIEDTEEEFNQRGNGNYRKNFKGYIFYEPGKFLGASVVLGKMSDYDKSPFTVWVFDNPENLSIDSWDKKYWYYPFIWGDFTSIRNEVAPVNEATISGKLAKFGVVDYRPEKPKFIYISNNGKMYLLRVIGDEGEKILESFKFL